MDQKNIEKKCEGYLREMISCLSDLVAIPTSNPPGEKYKECVDYMARKLTEWKIGHQVISRPDGDHPRYFIVGSIGKGESLLHFHGHYDVVPASSPDQFKPCVRGGWLYGRGSSDMKGGLTSMLFALRLIRETGRDTSGCITFSIVPDEETGGDSGTGHLFTSNILPRPRWGMLMPEPTGGVIWNANKGALTQKITLRGKSAHVALAHQGINAFEQMAEVVHSLLKLKNKIERRTTRLPVASSKANRSVMLIGGQSGSGFNFNVVPENAYFTLDRRLNPEESLRQAKREIKEVLDAHRNRGIQIDVETMQEGKPSRASERSPLARALSRSIRECSGHVPRFELCPGLCEIRFFNNRRIPAYAYGPGRLEVSHGPEECVRVVDVSSCARIYTLTADRLLNS
ncbi:MAG: ArgE/DapE family deacylase [Candidatus Aminicenantales bacterium]